MGTEPPPDTSSCSALGKPCWTCTQVPTVGSLQQENRTLQAQGPQQQQEWLCGCVGDGKGFL